MRSILMALVVTGFSLNASAGIIGMLGEGDSTKLELVEVTDGKVKVALTSNYDFPVLHLSRYLGGEGGNVMAMLAALDQGKVPEGQKVSEWMAPDTGRASLKVGVFVNKEKHSFVSMFTGQQVNLEMATSQRTSSKDLGNGVMKQVFEFSVADFAGPNAAQLTKGEIDLALVTQSRAPGAWDSEMKKSIEVNLAIPGSANACSKVLN
jgi:hypothetical protein